VAVIGAGFSGIAAAIALRKRDIAFEIFDSADGVGGTWWKNRYPGAEVDLESHIYSFSFEPHDWTRTHASWAELQRYLEDTASKWGLLSHLNLGVTIEEVRWDDASATYSLRTSTNADYGAFSAVISAVGFLNIPLYPPFAKGANAFEGDLVHTATWPEGLTMKGKSVAVLGTGSSAVQIVQEAVKDAREVTIFQRQPNWVLPKGARDFTNRERRLNQLKPVYQWRRARLYLGYDARQFRASHARTNGYFNRIRREASLKFLQESLAGRPDLIELCTPSFPFESKRTVVSDTYYPSLRDPKVTLLPYGVKELTVTGVVDDNGDEHDFDMVVMATGFDAANFLGNYRVYGEGGLELHDHWKGEPQAFLGLMVPSFPNFFMMYGPNTNAVPLVNFYEAQARFAVHLIEKLRHGKRTIRIKPVAMRHYNDWLQKRLRRTVWGATSSYFLSGSGRVVSQWPDGVTLYTLLTRVLRRSAVEVS
jgi:cyclohexanone monooxygenase